MIIPLGLCPQSESHLRAETAVTTGGRCATGDEWYGRRRPLRPVTAHLQSGKWCGCTETKTSNVVFHQKLSQWYHLLPSTPLFTKCDQIWFASLLPSISPSHQVTHLAISFTTHTHTLPSPIVSRPHLPGHSIPLSLPTRWIRRWNKTATYFLRQGRFLLHGQFHRIQYGCVCRKGCHLGHRCPDDCPRCRMRFSR